MTRACVCCRAPDETSLRVPLKSQVAPFILSEICQCTLDLEATPLCPLWTWCEIRFRAPLYEAEAPPCSLISGKRKVKVVPLSGVLSTLIDP